tara:strand:+ start:1610 stop:1711 length:102 start_codon:yes stop_codon:yes gene_type:complete
MQGAFTGIITAFLCGEYNILSNRAANNCRTMGS